jgi:hypothetical protein
MVRATWTVRPPEADCPANFLQTKTTDSTDRNEAKQELTKNTKNNRLMGKRLGQPRLVREVVRMRGRSKISQSHQKPITKMHILLSQTLLGTD